MADRTFRLRVIRVVVGLMILAIVAVGFFMLGRQSLQPRLELAEAEISDVRSQLASITEQLAAATQPSLPPPVGGEEATSDENVANHVIIQDGKIVFRVDAIGEEVAPGAVLFEADDSAAGDLLKRYRELRARHGEGDTVPTSFPDRHESEWGPWPELQDIIGDKYRR